MKLSKQAQNSLELFKGNPPSTIERALRIQRKEVVEELKEHFGVDGISELAAVIAFR